MLMRRRPPLDYDSRAVFPSPDNDQRLHDPRELAMEDCRTRILYASDCSRNAWGWMSRTKGKHREIRVNCDGHIDKSTVVSSLFN
ncbi:hypothetical protein SAY87_007714 [Trapa incisa]|uniref:Uncharacterized protein n=1 Tax=Trapa incisa TaxID=236973 RepID=A0AAN7KND6_9MYRT|nr:hypothetical protein SAY87_007714 [Trapa incisa]